MKKLIYSTIALCCFTLAIVLFQISCQKDAVAKSNSTGQNKFLYTLQTGSENSLWISNNDGSNRQQIPITMPSTYSIIGIGKLTVDGTTVIFTGFNSSNFAVFSVSINGGTALKLFDTTISTSTGGVTINQCY